MLELGALAQGRGSLSNNQEWKRESEGGLGLFIARKLGLAKAKLKGELGSNLCHGQAKLVVAGRKKTLGAKGTGAHLMLAAKEPFKSEVRGQGADLALCHGARVRGRTTEPWGGPGRS